MASVTKFIEEKMGLKINVIKSKVDRLNGIKYLGFGFYYETFSHQFKAKSHHISVKKLKDKLKQLTSRSWGVNTSYRVIKLKQLVVGWVSSIATRPISVSSYYKIEPPYTEPYVRWCERTDNQLMIIFLLDYFIYID